LIRCGAERNSWAVIGGGMLGLTLAHRLAQRGKRVTLFEAEAFLGGLASAWSLQGVVWDRHYHVILLSDSHLRGLLRELALDEEIRWVETRTGIYAGGTLYPLSNSLDYLRLPFLSLSDKLRLAATIVYGSRCRDWRRLERITVEMWLRRLSGRRTFEALWLPLLRAKLGEDYRITSAAFIWGTIQRLYAARRTGLKKEMFGYVPGGYARILDRFAGHLEKEGVAIHLGAGVKEVAPAAGGLVVRTERAQQAFDKVAVTTPAPIANPMCAGLAPAEREALSAIRYQGIVCAAILLKRPLAGYYLTYLADDRSPFTAVVEMTGMVDPRELGGHALVYLPRYVTASDPFFAASDSEVADVFLKALGHIYPSFRPGDVAAFRVSRAPHVFALPTLGYSDKLPPMTTSIPGLHIVNSAHIVNGTTNVNETVALAENAVKRLGAG
jgi:protoporphyrinogen oxidase